MYLQPEQVTDFDQSIEPAADKRARRRSIFPVSNQLRPASDTEVEPRCDALLLLLRKSIGIALFRHGEDAAAIHMSEKSLYVD